MRRFKCVKQPDQSDCGAAALATIAIHYNLPFRFQRIRDFCGTDRSGTNLLGLLEAAEKIGFSAKAVKGTYDNLSDIPLPAIAHVITDEGLGHFVVVHRVKKSGVVVADPAKGIGRLSRKEFCEKWSGYVLIVVPDHQARAAVSERPTTPGRQLIRLLWPHRPILVEAFLCAILMTALGVTTAYFIQHLVDSVLVHNESKLLNALALGMMLVVLFQTAFGMLRHYLLIHISRKVDLSLISQYASHILRLPMNFFETRRVGEILSRVNDAVKVREAVGGTSLTAVVDGTLVLISAALMFIYDVPLSLAACAFIPLLVLSVMGHHRPIKRRSRETMENAADLEAHLFEDVSGVETVKAFGVERVRLDQGEARLVKLIQSVFSLEKYGLSMNAFGMIVPGIAGIVVLWYGGHRVISGALTIGQLMFFYTLLGYMLAPLGRLASVNLQLQDALVALDRLSQIFEIEIEKSKRDDKSPLKELGHGIQLQNVSFRYGCRDNVLSDVSLNIPAGSTVGIVGDSGSGKTTILKLLMRFYDPVEGQILFDGIDSRDVMLDSLRSRIGVVSQEPFIFHGTVRDNIALGHADATMPEIVAAARDAGIDEFILKLPQRYDTMIGERGANLSGGQRQRLAIARVCLMQPEILIFDEATSHLDTATERAIQRNLQERFADKTVILVAHRLSTIRSADTIYVMKDGRVAEYGTHNELLVQTGQYAALWHAQTQCERAPDRKRTPTHNGRTNSILATAGTLKGASK